MHVSLFDKLATDLSLSRAQAFSQKIWRKYHYSSDPGTLCSGLTYFWLNEKLCSRSPMSQFEEPSAELRHHLTRMQALSYYPDFPENFNPSKKDLLLLTKKYGTDDWKNIQQRVIDKHQGDYVLYDLSRVFRYDSASVVRFTDLPQTLPCLNSLSAGSAMIGVLRYLKRGQPDGHRVAYYLDRNNQHHFFDPNAGEVIEPCDTLFHQWLNSFLIHASYRKFEPSINDAFLTLYNLKNVSPQTQVIRGRSRMVLT
ncbi:YopT-type cysteine protease domain-containing protein [Pseudomonadota bacterium]